MKANLRREVYKVKPQIQMSLFQSHIQIFISLLCDFIPKLYFYRTDLQSSIRLGPGSVSTSQTEQYVRMNDQKWQESVIRKKEMNDEDRQEERSSSFKELLAHFCWSSSAPQSAPIKISLPGSPPLFHLLHHNTEPSVSPSLCQYNITQAGFTLKCIVRLFFKRRV